MDREYWNTFYKDKKEPAAPSPFAQHLGENYFKGLMEDKSIIELGCGDGRDAVYFGKMGLKVLAVEQCESAVNNLNGHYANENMKFIEDDFTDFATQFEENFDYVYSRFTLHAVKEGNEDKVLKWVYENLKKGGLFFLEVRSTKDELFGKGELIAKNTYKYNDHNRRFVDFDTIKEKLSIYSKVIESKLSNGLAVYGDADPIVIRMIVQK